MNEYDRMSSEDIERDVEQSRETIGSTLGELRSRVKPARLANEALEFARNNGGSSFFRRIGTTIRDNPVPSALLGAGLAWAVANRTGAFSRFTGGGEGDEGAYPQRMDLAAAKAYRPPRHDEVERAEEMQAELPYDDEYGDTADSDSDDSDLAQRARAAMSDAGDTVSGAAEDAAAIAREFGEKARGAAQRVQERARTIAEEQPLTLALAGLAIGALIGAVVRGTSHESKLMGDASRQVRTRAHEKAREGLDEASAVAERTLETVRDEINERAGV